MASFQSRQGPRHTSVKPRRNKPSVLNRSVVIQGIYSGSDSSSDESIYDDVSARPKDRTSTITVEYWHVVKAMKYMRMGNASSCVLSLTVLDGVDLKNKESLKALLEDNGLEMLVNLTEVANSSCVACALQVLNKITYDSQLIRQLVNLGLCSNLVKIVGNIDQRLNYLACDLITSIAHNKIAARRIRKLNGIQKIVGLLDVQKNTLLMDSDHLNDNEKMTIKVTRSAAYALWSLCTFTKNKEAAAVSGVISVMSDIILSGNKTVAIPMTGMLCECSSEVSFQKAIAAEGLVGVLLHDMSHHDGEMEILCAYALANAAGRYETVSHMIRFHNGIDLVMDLLRKTDNRRIKFIGALLTLVWKSCSLPQNAKRYEVLRASYVIIPYIDRTDMFLRIPATGAVAELAKQKACRNRLTKLEAVPPLIKNLLARDDQLLKNTAQAIGELVKNEKAMEQVQSLDGIRLLWSLLNYNNEDVQIQALSALVPVVRCAPNSGEIVRSLVGSLEMLVKKLRGENDFVLSGVCALISQVALDRENLMVMSEYGLVRELSSMIIREGETIIRLRQELQNLEKDAKNKDAIENFDKIALIREALEGDITGLRRELSRALATCCVTNDITLAFGLSGIITSLVQFLDSRDFNLRAQACQALWQLSLNALNCVQIHFSGAVAPLLRIISQDDQVAQISAAGCLNNLRSYMLRIERGQTCLVNNNNNFREVSIAGAAA